MASQIELLTKMTHILDGLIDNAKNMKEGMRLKFSPKELEALQQRQHEILHELGQLDKILQNSPLGTKAGEVSALKEQIQEKLALFQTINKEFFDHFNVHTRVIDHTDISEKKKH